MIVGIRVLDLRSLIGVEDLPKLDRIEAKRTDSS
jgi:hypothetical protein